MKETGAFLDEDNEMQFDDQGAAPEEPVRVVQQIADKLSAENLSQMNGGKAPSQKSAAPSKAGSKKSKASQRPAWALTEK